jgi:hypothetical protein
MREYEFQVGQKVVIYESYPRSDGHYQVGTVERVTATQVTVDGVRYMRSYPCYQYGYSDSSYANRLVLDVTPEQATTRNAEWRKEQEITRKWNQLRAFRWNRSAIPENKMLKVYGIMESLGLFKGEP